MSVGTLAVVAIAIVVSIIHAQAQHGPDSSDSSNSGSVAYRDGHDAGYGIGRDGGDPTRQGDGLFRRL